MNHEICLNCPLPDCDERDPRCPCRPLMSDDWRRRHPVRITRTPSSRVETANDRREYFREYYRANRERKIEDAKRRQREGKLKRYTAEERREYFRNYKRRQQEAAA